MTKRSFEKERRLASVAMLLLLAGCASDSQQERMQTDAGLSARQAFSAIDADSSGRLDTLEIEKSGFGDHWNTLDSNGDGAVSLSEWRQRFDTLSIQRRLNRPNMNSIDPQSAVDESFRLPPAPPQRSLPVTPVAAGSVQAPSSADVNNTGGLTEDGASSL